MTAPAISTTAAAARKAERSVRINVLLCCVLLCRAVFNRVYVLIERGSPRINPKKISVHPPDPRHPRSINPYTNVKCDLRVCGRRRAPAFRVGYDREMCEDASLK